MANRVLVNEDSIRDIASAIKEQSGDWETSYTPGEMGDAIRNLPIGDGPASGPDIYVDGVSILQDENGMLYTAIGGGRVGTGGPMESINNFEFDAPMSMDAEGWIKSDSVFMGATWADYIDDFSELSITVRLDHVVDGREEYTYPLSLEISDGAGTFRYNVEDEWRMIETVVLTGDQIWFYHSNPDFFNMNYTLAGFEVLKQGEGEGGEEIQYINGEFIPVDNETIYYDYEMGVIRANVGGGEGPSGGSTAIDNQTIITNENGELRTAIGGAMVESEPTIYTQITEPIDSWDNAGTYNGKTSWRKWITLKSFVNGTTYYVQYVFDDEFVQTEVVAASNSLALPIAHYTATFKSDRIFLEASVEETENNHVLSEFLVSTTPFVVYEKVDANYLPIDNKTIKNVDGVLTTGLDSIITDSNYNTFLNISDNNALTSTRMNSYNTSQYMHMEGYNTKLDRYAGTGSHVEGNINHIYSGGAAHAEGYGTTIDGGIACHTEGYYTKIGSSINGLQGTNGLIQAAHAEGYYTIAGSAYQHVQGKYNILDTASSYAHIVGNGDSSTRANAFTLDWSGNAVFAGTVGGPGADYAEYFEWADGNKESEDRVGLIVALQGSYIRLAQPGDDVLGIVSGTAMVLGDNAEWNWNKKFLTDDFGRVIYDMVEEFTEVDGEMVSSGYFPKPRLNPEYDPEQIYEPRSKRMEWDTVGLMGKMYVRDDGTCIIGGYAAVGADGIATNATNKTNMRVMERVNDNVIRVLMK